MRQGYYGEKEVEVHRLCDFVLMSWLLNSVVPSIGRSMEGLSTYVAIWTTLFTLYSGKGIFMLIY